MEDETSSDLQKCLSDGQMDTDEGPLINENSNGLSHLLTEGEFNSVDAAVVDESSTSNQGFLNAVELSGGSVGDYLENNTNSFNADNFDVGDNAVTFPSDSLNVLSDGDSRLSESAYKTVVSDIETDASESQKAKMDVDEEIDKGDDYSNLQKIDEDSNIIHKIDDDSNITNENELLQNTELAQTELSNAAAKSEGKVNEVVEEILDSNDQFDTDPENGAKIVKKTNSTHHENDVVEKDNKGGGAEETENVSEDELPTVEKPSVKDAENVSDDELPGPKPADLPADTEVVSEDELPSSKKESRKRKTSGEKEGYDPHSPTSEENANKKVALSKNGESKPISAEKRPSTDEKKPLPELDKYWKVVNDDPTDFTGWTYLLQYVDQENDVEAAREAYDAFLSHYPYCYGYWRKYADYEKRKGSKKKCLEVLERGLKAIPLSVDLWIHYLNHIKTTRTEDLAFIRSQYERAIDTCGLEFRSDRLWESYIKWESENGNALNVTKIYDRLLATPTLGYTSHFDNFQEHIMSEPVVSAVETAELVRLRGEVRAAGDSAPQLDLPPGEDEPPTHLASEEEGQAIKERIIAARRKIHKTTGEEVAARWTFEEGIKRPYFHVKPLERCQLKNWKSYLEWEKQHGSFKRALVLHERCLIACALYEEFWMRLIKFLEERSAADPDLIAIEREVLERACTVHHLDKPELHLHWAHFEEAQGNADKAAEILDRIEKNCPSLVRIQYRRVNLERRRGDYDKVCQLYEGYIAAAKSKPIASALAIKYARFLFHIKKDHAAARAVLDEAISKEPLNHRLHSQRLDLAIHTPGIEFEQLEELCQSYEKQECADAEVCASMAWRRQELAEELGGAAAARAAALHAQAAARALRKRNRKEKHDAPPPPAITQPPSDNTTVANKRKDVTENTQIDPSKPKRRRVRPLIRVRKRKAPRQTQQPPQITTERPATTSSNTRRPTPRPPGGTSSPPHPTSTTRPRPGHSTLTTTRSRPRHSTLTATRLRPGHSTQTTTRLPTDYGNPITIRSRPGQINPNTTRPRPDHSNPTSTRPRPDHSNPTSTRPRPDHSNPTSTRPRSGHSTTTRLRPGHINTTTIRSRPSHSIQTSTRPRPGYSTQTTTRTLFTRRPLPAWM